MSVKQLMALPLTYPLEYTLVFVQDGAQGLVGVQHQLYLSNVLLLAGAALSLFLLSVYAYILYANVE